MITKNLKIFFFSLLFFAYQANILATETEIDALEISILDKGNKIVAKGSVKAITNNGYEISSDIAIYNKKNKTNHLFNYDNVTFVKIKANVYTIREQIEFLKLNNIPLL